MKKLLLAAVAALALNGCALLPNGEISGAAPGLHITNSTIVTDLQSAAFNLDSAVTVGALSVDDPAPKCLHDLLVKAGIEMPAGQAPAKSFIPKHDGVASAGAIAYIIAQQLKQGAGVPVVSSNCEALVGRVVIDGVEAAKKAVPSFIPGLLH
jgi:hypothetical protein